LEAAVETVRKEEAEGADAVVCEAIDAAAAEGVAVGVFQAVAGARGATGEPGSIPSSKETTTKR